MYVVSVLALLTLFGGVEPLMLKNQPDSQQQQLPPTTHVAALGQSQYGEQQTLDNDAGSKNQKPERLYPEFRQQLPQQQSYLSQSPVNPTLAYVIIKPIPQQLYSDNLGYNRRPSYLQQPYQTYFRENEDARPPSKGQTHVQDHDDGSKAPPAEGQTYIQENDDSTRAPPTKGQTYVQEDDVKGPPTKGQPLPPPDGYPVQEHHDYLQEFHSKKQSKFARLKQHIDRVFQKFASHSSYQINDDEYIPPPRPDVPDHQHPVQVPEQEPEQQQQVQQIPVKEETKAPSKQQQQVVEELKDIKEIKEHREGELKKETVRAPQVANSHLDEGFSKRHNVN